MFEGMFSFENVMILLWDKKREQLYQINQ